MSAGCTAPPLIRLAAPGDREPLLRLRQALHAETSSTSPAHSPTRQQADAGGGLVLLAQAADGERIGFLETRPHPGGARLEALFVVPHRRRTGVARHLLQAAEGRLASVGIESLWVELSGSEDEHVARLERLGFRPGSPLLRLERRLRLRGPALGPADHALPAGGAAGVEDLAILRAAAARGEEPVLLVHSPRRRRWWLLHLVLAAAALVCLANTDVFSPDPVKGAVLPIVDALFGLYFGALIVHRKYRQKTDASLRAGQLFEPDGGGDRA